MTELEIALEFVGGQAKRFVRVGPLTKEFTGRLAPQLVGLMGALGQ
ncbi:MULTISPECIES: hypothetical protein [unclassified Rhodococcus (in: high G+C Gram-positive bacteria)]|nr:MULTISPECIES: hypothetical protein [unclassified Rhodococcus (in: high G+C Gram-positive bacteria)]